MDIKLLEILFKTHYASLHRYANSLLCDNDESSDAVSDVFAKILECGPDITADTALQYLMSAVRNHCINILKQRRTSQSALTLYMLQLPQYDDDSDATTIGELQQFISNNFHGTAAQVMQMKYVTGMESKDIAQLLGISSVAVYKHIARSMQFIKTNFKKKL